MTEDDLKNQFSNYERTVWIVNSIEGHLLKYYRDVLECFDRFPKFPVTNGEYLTPDFAVSFNSGLDILGEIKRSFGSKAVSLEETYDQICKYDQPLNSGNRQKVLTSERATHMTFCYSPIWSTRRRKRRVFEN
jgi:hypothetical protein